MDPATSKSPYGGTAFWLFRSLHFRTTQNFINFLLGAGLLFTFSVSRLPYIDFDGVFCKQDGSGRGAVPGECFWYTKHAKYRFGIVLHLVTCLPAGILAVLQFIPAIRHKVPWLHRLNGYVVVALALASQVGVFLITEVSFGGELYIQLGIYALVAAHVASLALAWVYIRQRRIDLHRAWMLRAWIYAASVITTRFAMYIAARLISEQLDDYYLARRCDVIHDLFQNNQATTIHAYPGCLSFYDGSNPSQYVAVKADFNGNPAEFAASLGIGFGVGGWLAFLLHVAGAELYLYMTSDESSRLWKISEHRIKAARRAGSPDPTDELTATDVKR